jgi:CheY-like chemotaxis protein/DNA-binding XRE family transcriptional regulator
MARANVKQRFGLAVKNLRTKSGISQEELAWRAGLHRSYVADIERGARNLSLQSIEKLASALRVSLSALFEPLQDSPRQVSGVRAADELVDILLVEDEAHTERTIRAFRMANVRNRIHVASDGTSALEYLYGTGRPPPNAEVVKGEIIFEYLYPSEEAPPEQLQNRPKLILLDLNLPKLGGMKVLRQIKKDERTRNIPVIGLIASRRSKEFLESKRLGAELYIEKPVNFRRFCEVAPKLSCYWGLFRPSDATTGLAPR